jgi:23S rRNA pseudouridine2605 synthase
MTERVRINRFLAAAGLGARRKCEELIRSGVVRVNGERIASLNITIDPEKDLVSVDGKEVRRKQKRLVLVMNKPTGVLSTASDSFNRRTVIQLAHKKGYTERLFPVGRLDLDTSGILIITNDGELAYRLTHPRFKIEKTYRVTVAGRVSGETVRKLESGIRRGDFSTRPCRVTIIEEGTDYTELEVILKEGRKRQIKRMFSSFGHTVLKLHRSALGDLDFKNLQVGDIRPVTKQEENRLRELTGLV